MPSACHCLGPAGVVQIGDGNEADFIRVRQSVGAISGVASDASADQDSGEGLGHLESLPSPLGFHTFWQVYHLPLCRVGSRCTRSLVGGSATIIITWRRVARGPGEKLSRRRPGQCLWQELLWKRHRACLLNLLAGFRDIFKKRYPAKHQADRARVDNGKDPGLDPGPETPAGCTLLAG